METNPLCVTQPFIRATKCIVFDLHLFIIMLENINKINKRYKMKNHNIHFIRVKDKNRFETQEIVHNFNAFL